MANTDRIFNISFPDSLEDGMEDDMEDDMDMLVYELLDMLSGGNGGLITYDGQGRANDNGLTNLLDGEPIDKTKKYISIYRNKNSRKIKITLHEKSNVNQPFELIDYYYWISHILNIYASKNILYGITILDNWNINDIHNPV